MQTQMNEKIQHQFKCIPFIAMTFVLSMVGSSLLVNRVMVIGGFTVPGGILLYPLSYFFGDIIAEIYGYKIARHILWVALLWQLAFSILINIMLKIPPAPFWHNQAAYETVFGPTIIYCVSCLVGTVLGGFANIYAISKWKILVKGRYFWLRSIASTTIGEAVFSVVALTPVFINSHTFGTIAKIVICSYVFKLIYTIIMSPFIVIFSNFLKKYENIDVYDYGINYNPFKFGMN